MMSKMRYFFMSCLFFAIAGFANAQAQTPFESEAKEAFGSRDGAFVIIDCSSGAISSFRPEVAAKRFAPCSTFKIWNTLIGLETVAITSPDQAFYQWDGVERAIPAWNRNLTLREAFQASCVPAFQNLARRIGPERMQLWLDKIGYGNRDITAGIDVFWLPAKDRKTILISPMEQAQLLNSLVKGKLPFSEKSIAILTELMAIKKTDRGSFFGKTGSGADELGTPVLGWFAGYVESKGKTHVFACVAQGKNTMGKDAREIVEAVLVKQGFL